MKPNSGADATPHIVVTLRELERLRRAAIPLRASAGDRLPALPQERDDVTKSLRILVVEDDPMIGPLLAEMLEDLGHVVCGVETNATAAVAAARRCHPDLMIVDVGLGEASGIKAVREILREGFVPHVFVTGDVLSGLSLGPDAVLIQKPYRGTDLVAAIARAIGGRASRAEVGAA
jgi:DNA-binding response OmpR family regulator